ncbi:MAG: spermidine/putrescine ABC transporter substrate-binding protein [Candidatus Omnitrophota bacterium]
MNVYNREDYFAPDTLDNFEKKFGIKINLKTFEDEELMLSEIQSNPRKFDVVIASDNIVRELRQTRLLTEIDSNNIPNLKNIDKKFLDPSYDPGNRYSVPYLWGTTGIVINRAFIRGDEESWAVLWNPEYKKKIAMLNNGFEVIGSTLKYLGYSLNTSDVSELEEAKKKLLEQSPIIAGYLGAIEARNKLISGELWAVQQHSGEGMFAIDENEDLEYFIPKEGAAIRVDSMMIPRDAKHKYTAEVFINYILDPKVSADIANYLWYANCNAAAAPLTDKEILESPFLYPDEGTLKRCEFYIEGNGEEQRIKEQTVNRIWSELQLKRKQ